MASVGFLSRSASSAETAWYAATPPAVSLISSRVCAAKGYGGACTRRALETSRSLFGMVGATSTMRRRQSRTAGEWVRLQCLAGAQVRAAKITLGHRLLGPLNCPLFLVVPISGAPEKPEAEASEQDDQVPEDGFLHKYTGP